MLAAARHAAAASLVWAAIVAMRVRGGDDAGAGAAHGLDGRGDPLDGALVAPTAPAISSSEAPGLVGQAAPARLRRHRPSWPRRLLSVPVLDLGDQRRDLLGGAAGALGQLADLVGDDGEALALLAGPGRLDGRVQGQQVGLLGDVVDRLDDGADLLALGAELGDLGGGALRRLP